MIIFPVVSILGSVWGGLKILNFIIQNSPSSLYFIFELKV